MRVQVKALPTPQVDAAWVEEMCKAYRTKCEMPGCALLAEQVFLHSAVVCFLCPHHGQLAGQAPIRTSKLLITEMQRGLKLHSFYRLNADSGNQLVRAVRERQAAVLAQEERLKRAPQQELRELRQIVRESGIKPGMPDEELLTARQRSLRHEQAGTPKRGRPRRPVRPLPPAVHPRLQNAELFPVRPLL